MVVAAEEFEKKLGDLSEAKEPDLGGDKGGSCRSSASSSSPGTSRGSDRGDGGKPPIPASKPVEAVFTVEHVYMGPTGDEENGGVVNQGLTPDEEFPPPPEYNGLVESSDTDGNLLTSSF